MLIHPTEVSRATARRWRLWECAIVSILAAAFLYVVITTGDFDESRPMAIDTAYPSPDFTCPPGYDGPDAITEHVVRCTLRPAESIPAESK